MSLVLGHKPVLLAAAFGAALALGACTTLGPDFAAPAPTWDKDWRSPSLDGVALVPVADDRMNAGQGPHFWWRQFDDPALDALIAAFETGNINLRIAGLRVLEARALLAGARALTLPQSVVGSAAGGYGASAPDGAPIGSADFGFASGDISAGWELDFWGRFARTIESADANYAATRADRDDLGLILRAEVARTYLTFRTLQERLAVLRENAGLQQRSVEITERLFVEGNNGELDLKQAQTQLYSTQAGIPELEAAIVQTRNALALLLGRPPGPVRELALSRAALPVVPETLVAEMPADLLRRRPDVRAAAQRAGAQSARIGIARAALYPSLSLVGSVGVSRTTLGGLSNSVDIGVGPALRWNFLDFGRLRNAVRAEDARFEQALAAYRDTVLRAAVEVDNNAVALARNRDEDVILARAAEAARRSLALASLRYGEGLSSFQRVLDAQAALLRQQDRFIANRGQIATDVVALYKALGGGWISTGEAGLADVETRARMNARTNWGGLLPVVTTPETMGEAVGETLESDQPSEAIE